MIASTANLNADQLRAVEHPGGHLLVLAGPGTGKTKVLVARIAHLVGERGVSPDRILALTFSRRAAAAVRPPLLFEQQLDDHPLVRQVHARPVRRVDRNRL